MTTLRLLTPLLLAVLLSACFSKASAPSEAEARAALEQEIQRFSQGCIKLNEFHVANAQALGNLLIVEARAEIEFLEDCHWPVHTLVVVSKIPPGATPDVKKGERRTMDVKLQFHQTSQGWKSTPIKDAGAKRTP